MHKHESVETFTTLAVEAGAEFLALRPWSESGRLLQLCRRLGFHLSELRRSLHQDLAQTDARTQALTTLRTVAAQMVGVPPPQAEASREHFVTAVETERRRFLMATTVDAVVELDTQMTAAVRAELRRVAAHAVHDIGRQHLYTLRDRLQARSAPFFESLPRCLLAELSQSLRDHAQPISLETIVGVPFVARAAVNDVERPRTPRVFTSLLDHMRLSNTHRVTDAARDALVATLETRSQMLVDLLVQDYDGARQILEDQLVETLDACLRSAQHSRQFAAAALAEGPEGVSRAHALLDTWCATLSSIYVC